MQSLRDQTLFYMNIDLMMFESDKVTVFFLELLTSYKASSGNNGVLKIPRSGNLRCSTSGIVYRKN